MNIDLKAVAWMLLLSSTSAGAASAAPMPPGTLTAARDLHADKSATGYTLSGKLLSTNTCMDVRFSPLRKPDTFEAQQFKRAGSGPICGQLATFKPASLAVATAKVPPQVHVRVSGPKIVTVKMERP